MIQELIINVPKSSITKICNRFVNFLACVDIGQNNWRVIYDDGIDEVPLKERLATIRQRLAATSDNRETLYERIIKMTATELAKLFHDTYERLAPQYGYETREETKEFVVDSPNGALMIATCYVILNNPIVQQQLSGSAETASPKSCATCNSKGMEAYECYCCKQNGMCYYEAQDFAQS